MFAALAAVVGAVFLVAAFFLGFVVFLVVAGVALLSALAVYIRIRWFQHKLRKQGADRPEPFENSQSRGQNDPSTIEGEFTVVSRDRED